MEDFTNLKEALKQTLDEEFSEAILHIVHKHFGHQNDGTALSSKEIEHKVLREVLTTEAFSKLQNGVCIDLSTNKLVRHSSHGISNEKNACNCRLGLHSLLYADSSVESAREATETLLESLVCPSLPCRLQVLDSLSNLISVEQFSLSNWKLCENGLQSCLLNPLSVISEASLTVYVNALCLGSPCIVRESYRSLLKVASWILSKDSVLKGQCLDFSFVYTVINIIHNFQKNISKHWLRYPEEVIRSLVEETLDYFSTSASSGLLFVLYGLVDPCSHWLRNWLHCKLSKTCLFNIFEKHRHLIVNLIDFCQIFATDSINNERRVLQACQAVSFLLNLCSYEAGFQLVDKIAFEVNESSSLWTLLLVATANIGSPTFNEYFEKVFPNIFMMPSSYNKNVAMQKDNCQQYAVILEKLEFGDNSMMLILLSKCLEKVSETQAGQQFLLSNPVLFKAVKQFMMGAAALEQCNIRVVINFLHVLENFLHCHKGNELILVDNFPCLLVGRFCDAMRSNNYSFLVTLLCCPLGLYYCYNNKNDSKLCGALLDRCTAPIHNRCTVHSFLEARKLCQLFTFQSMVMSDDREFFNHICKKFLEFKEECCVCYGLNQASAKSKTELRKLSMCLEVCINSLASRSFAKTDFKQILLLFRNCISCSNCADQIILNILCLCVCNLRTLFCLISMFDFQTFLLEMQMNEIEDDKIRVCEATVMSNHVLVRTLVLGGPSERVVPPKSVKDQEYKYPFISSQNCLSRFCVTKTTDVDTRCSESKFGDTVRDLNSLKEFLLGNLKVEDCYHKVDFTILEKLFADVVIKADEEVTCSTDHKVSIAMQFSLKKAIDYGIACNMLPLDVSTENHVDNLTRLLNFSHALHPSGYKNKSFNFFVATIFIMSSGKAELARKLITFSFNKDDCCLAFGEMFNFIVANEPSCQKGKLCNIFDVIVKEHLPHIYRKLLCCGIRPSDLWLLWTGQMFWNYFDFYDIGLITLFCIVCGAEHALYCCVSVLKFLEDRILQCHNDYDLEVFLKEHSFVDFSLSQQIPFITFLHHTHAEFYNNLFF